MSVNDFSSTRGRKRARVKNTAIDYKPEVKIWNIGFANDQFPSSIKMTNVACKPVNNDRATGYGSWCPLAFQYPAQGSGSNQRIGRKINIRWIRIKGYIRSFQRLMMPCRWRLVLYRTDYNAVDLTNPSNKLAPLWLNYEEPFSANDASTVHERCCHNYYKLIKDVEYWKLHNVSRTVLCSGILQPPPWRDPQGFYSSVGSNPQIGKIQHSTAYWHGWYVNDYVNARIALNDTFAVTESITEGGVTKILPSSCYYCLQLETDLGIGITGVHDQNFLGSNDVWSTSHDDRLFELSFFIRGYFTDA